MRKFHSFSNFPKKAMNINLFLFIFFLSLLLSSTFSAPCTSENCKIENNCRCASKTIPGGLNRADIPQFVVFTLDDSIYERQYELVQHVDFLLKNPNIQDALGCNMKLSYYVRQIGIILNFKFRSKLFFFWDLIKKNIFDIYFFFINRNRFPYCKLHR